MSPLDLISWTFSIVVSGVGIIILSMFGIALYRAYQKRQ